MNKFLNQHWIAKIIILYLWLIGIRKGRRFIFYSPGFSDRADGGLVAWSEITSFNYGWVTSNKFYFDVGYHSWLQDEKTAKDLNAIGVFIQSEFYSTGFIKIKKFRLLLKAQGWLQLQFKQLYNPPTK